MNLLDDNEVILLDLKSALPGVPPVTVGDILDAIEEKMPSFLNHDIQIKHITAINDACIHLLSDFIRQLPDNTKYMVSIIDDISQYKFIDNCDNIILIAEQIQDSSLFSMPNVTCINLFMCNWSEHFIINRQVNSVNGYGLNEEYSLKTNIWEIVTE